MTGEEYSNLTPAQLKKHILAAARYSSAAQLKYMAEASEKLGDKSFVLNKKQRDFIKKYGTLVK